MKQKVFYYFLSFMILAVSCSPAYKLAREFHENPPDFYLELQPPDYLFKFNHKGEAIEGFDSLSNIQQDSALFSSSTFIRNINDSIFLETYMNSFLDELRMLDFKVYLGSASDSFLLSKPQSYLVNIAQIQLDEYFYPYEDREFYYDTLYIKTFDLNAIDFSIWLELKKMSNSQGNNTILYSSHMLSDALDGDFWMDPFYQTVKYSYNIDSLTVRDVYEIAGYLGKIHASYLYDFFMNQYIQYHLPQGFMESAYYHYNRFKGSFTVIDEERFELLDTR